MATTSYSLSALLKQTTIDDHEAILKECNISLKQAKGDLQIQHIKFVALLKLDRYDDALRVLEEGGNNLKQKARFEHAYALYKVGDLEQANKIAESIEDERGARHVEAQAVCSNGFTSMALLTGLHSHIVSKISQERQLFTESWLAIKLSLRMKKATCASTVERLMPNSSGRGRGILRKSESHDERTWRLLKRHITQLVVQLREGSWARVRSC